MCISPIVIDNPYYGCDPRKGVNYLHDCTHSKISVPCGHCEQCYSVKQNGIIQRFIIEHFESDFFFCTLTYSPEAIPRITLDGKIYNYPDYRDFRCFIKRLEKQNIFDGSFKYYAVSEYGGKRHRPHFHVIFALPKLKSSSAKEHHMLNTIRERKYHDKVLSEWRRNISSTRNPIWQPLCEYHYDFSTGRRNFDFHYVSNLNTQYSTSSSSDCNDNTAFYVSKYVLKLSSYERNLVQYLYAAFPERFSELSRLFKTRSYCSKDFGRPDTKAQWSHVRKGIQYAIDKGLPYPQFFNPSTGQIFGLSSYYKHKCFSYADATVIYLNSNSQHLDSHHVIEDDTPYQMELTRKHDKQSIDKFEKKLQKIREKYCE